MTLARVPLGGHWTLARFRVTERIACAGFHVERSRSNRQERTVHVPVLATTMAVVATHAVAVASSTARPTFSGFRRVAGPAALTRDTPADHSAMFAVRALSAFPRAFGSSSRPRARDRARRGAASILSIHTWRGSFLALETRDRPRA